nr:MAG TPA: hypothetical protein [Caudoviricetes sp.]
MLEIVKLLQDYSVQLVCSAVVILWFNKIMTSQAKTQNDLMIQNREFMERIFTLLSKANYSQNGIAMEDDTSEFVSERMSDLLDEFRKTYKVSRVYYIAYHNGTRDLKGLHFSQISCRIESVMPGVSPKIHELQSVPRALFLKWSRELKENKGYCVVKVNNGELVKSDPALTDFMKLRSCLSVMGKCITDSENEVRGMLMAEFLENITLIPNFNMVKEDFTKLGYRISEELIILDHKNGTSLI